MRYMLFTLLLVGCSFDLDALGPMDASMDDVPNLGMDVPVLGTDAEITEDSGHDAGLMEDSGSTWIPPEDSGSPDSGTSPMDAGHDAGHDAGTGLDSGVPACVSPPYVVCGSDCVDVRFDMAHCGACGWACDSTRADSCWEGVCRCGADAECPILQVCVSGVCTGS